MVNQWVGIGRVTSDIDLAHFQSGTAYCRFSIACDRRTKKDAEKQTDFIPVKCLGKLAEVVAEHSGKGRLVAVLGPMQVDKYEKDGQKRTFTYVLANEVKFLDWPKDKQSNGNGGNGGNKQQHGNIADSYQEISFSEEDIPF